MNLIGIMVVTAIVSGFGIALFYLIWLKTRPHKETWKARIYQLGEGVREPKVIKDKDGNIKAVIGLKLQDLKPYSKDTLEKVEKDNQTVYRLQKLNKTTSAVEGDVVEYWGKEDKEVAVLKVKDGYTLLRKGYDKGTGEILFDPLPHDRINMIKGEMAVRKDRLQKEKDILAAITPWIVTGMCIMGLVAIAYILGSTFMEMTKQMDETMARSDANLLRIEQMRLGITPEPHSLGSQDVISINATPT